MEAAASEWQVQLKYHFSLGKITLDILLFADVQIIFAKSKDELQMATLPLGDKMSTYNLEMSRIWRRIWLLVVNTKLDQR
jgi:hypothetical protein